MSSRAFQILHVTYRQEIKCWEPFLKCISVSLSHRLCKMTLHQTGGTGKVEEWLWFIVLRPIIYKQLGLGLYSTPKTLTLTLPWFLYVACALCKCLLIFGLTPFSIVYYQTTTKKHHSDVCSVSESFFHEVPVHNYDRTNQPTWYKWQPRRKCGPCWHWSQLSSSKETLLPSTM